MNKREKIMKLRELYFKFSDNLVLQFFDWDSEKMLDEKLEVFQALAEGKTPIDIPKYYDVLELYPKDGALWD